jgi:hypothetical protein
VLPSLLLEHADVSVTMPGAILAMLVSRREDGEVGAWARGDERTSRGCEEISSVQGGVVSTRGARLSMQRADVSVFGEDLSLRRADLSVRADDTATPRNDGDPNGN